MRSTVRLISVILFVLSFLPAPGQAQDASDPATMIENLHSALLRTMKEAEALGVRGRYEALAPTLRDTYDFSRMAAVAAGSHWAEMDETEKSAVAEAFAHFSIATYASRFDGFSGEAFEVAGVRDGPRGSRLVDTRIIRGNGEAVSVTYVMVEREGGLRIVDVLLDKSISELAVRRSEYSKILADKGPAGLVETLNEKADAMLEATG